MTYSDTTNLKRLSATLRGFTSARDGVIAVEFGLVIPIIMTLILGVVEVSLALSSNLSVQSAARAGTNFGLTKPPIQGDMSPIIASVRAAMPTDWVSASDGSAPQINASLVCECEITGPAACGAPCAAGEAKQTYLKVEVQKLYKPLVSFRYFSPSFKLKNASMVRLK